MAKVKKYGPYTRLTPTRTHVGGYSSLWLADDHLLAVKSSGYSDAYKRFYFRDIQGLLIEDSERRFYVNLVLGLLWAGITGLILLSGGDWLVHAVFALLLGVPLVVNTVRGPTCKVYLITQVQAVRLDSIARRSRFEKFVDTVKPLIEAAQADFPRPPRAAGKPPGVPSSIDDALKGSQGQGA